jgi:hypothetical protein
VAEEDCGGGVVGGGLRVEKIDFRKTLKNLYRPPVEKFVQVDVPPMRYLTVEGAGNPNSAPEYRDAVEALYSVSYPLKFASKKELGRDYVVPPLEGLWWANDMNAFTQRRKDDWLWTMMIMVPEWISPSMIERVIATVRNKKSMPGLERICAQTIAEGHSVQTMYIGSYDDEGPVLTRLHDEYMPQHGLHFNGKHHEIYIGDPRKTASEKLKTILRQPVK